MIHSKKKPVVWQLSVLELDDITLVNGTIVNALPFAFNKKTGYLKNAVKSISSYFLKPFSNQNIIIKFNKQTKPVNTNSRGSFSVVFAKQIQTEAIAIEINGGKRLETVQSYPLFFKAKSGKIDIISDIDDTIVASYTKSIFKRIGSILFTPPEKRKPIGFTQNLFNGFKHQNSRVQYLSKSESNLFAMLSAIIQNHNLPQGNLILTPYLKFNELFSSKKGRDFKLNQIKYILDNTKTKNYILIGDDTQKDMEVYSEIINRYPDRILKVYIRQTKKNIRSYQKMMLDKLKATGIEVTYFNEDTSLDPAAEYDTLINKTP